MKFLLADKALILSDNDYVIEKVSKALAGNNYEGHVVEREDDMLTRGKEAIYKAIIAHLPFMGKEPAEFLEQLKELLEGKTNIIFVDNEKVFKDALKKGKYQDYFIDSFAGDSGHCSIRGNRLLAENIANTIISEKFSKQKS